MRIDAQRQTILIVDDSPENITILKTVLGANYRIRPAVNGRVALKAALIEPLPDLILLDVMMPEMDGHAVCRQLKADRRTRDIPVMFVTGKAQETDELLGLQLGAVDYITKPFSPPVVQARVKTHLALREATLTIAQQNQTLREERELIETILLRMRTADQLDSRHLRWLCSPVEQTAGDLLLSLFAPDGNQVVLLGDFTGHGLAAAIGGPLVSYIFHGLAGRGVWGPDLLREINNQLRARLPAGIFFAACLVEVEPSRRRAYVLNAGLPGCLLFRGSSQVREIPSEFLPLGIRTVDRPFPPGTLLDLQPADRLYLFTDGIIEARNPTGELFELARVERFLADHATRGAPLEAIYGPLQEFCQTDRYQDDITLVEICP
ncbi:MAG: SpoIIE family protein phosphatase [Magnetococcales bacterium]|nr:SpoIIE family protein phosphatase [Magnetococcales bacterium]